MISDCAAPHPDPRTAAACDRPVNHVGHHSRGEHLWPNADEMPRTPPPVPAAERFTIGQITADHTLRIEALNAAAHWLIGQEQDDLPRVLDAAREFEAYLRGTA